MRIGVFIVAYNAVTTLVPVLERIPESFRPSIEVVLVSDDFSTDDTYEVGVAYKRENGSLPIDRKSTRLNSSHITISYAVFCLKKKKKKKKKNIKTTK